MAKVCKIVFLLIFCSPPIFPARYDKIKFEHNTSEHGLSNDQVRCIIQDKYGFIWIGTHDGLNKYDGYEFTVYRYDPEDSLSLSSNWINSIYEDRSGDLWISTMGGGLNIFNREQEQFDHFSSKSKKAAGLKAITIKQIAEYHYVDEKVLWIGTVTGLHKMNLETKKFTNYRHTSEGAPYSHIQTVVVDNSGIVWIGSIKDGVHKFNPGTNLFTHYRYDPDNPYSLSDNQIFTLFFDSKNVLWIGTVAGGLNRFDPETEKFISFKYDPNDPYSISSNDVKSIYEDHAGVLWVGTADKGLNRFDRDTRKFTRFINDPGDPSSICDNTVWNIYEDESGVLWFGTWGGVSKIIPRKNQFTDYKMIPGDPNSLSDNQAGPVYISNRGGNEVLWIGTNRGLNRIDRKTGKITHYIHDPDNTKSIPNNRITSLFEDRSRVLWIGTQSDGLIKFDLTSGHFSSYRNDPNNPGSISDNFVCSIFEDKHGVLWVGTWDGGLDIFDRDKELFINVDKQTVTHIFEDRSGELWIARWPGIRKYDRETGKFTTYLRNREAKNYPELNRNNFICQPQFSERSILWIGTYSGLSKFDFKTEKYINYSVKDGLPSNIINGILEDNHGNLWLSTNKGLSKFNPKTKTFRNYNINDGLLSYQFSRGGCYKSKDGEMFFSGSKGVNAFYPNEIVNNKHIPNILITNFQLFNKSVSIKKDKDRIQNDTFSLKKHISTTEEVILSHQENVISFKFAALDYHSPQKNKYAYKLEGVDPEWVHTDASHRFASYTHLDPGEYIFHVKGTNNDGYWNEEGATLKVIILSPWWRTNLAYIFYLILLASIVSTTWRVQLRRIRLKQQLNMEHFEAEKLREVDELKSRFFANISHEFRTPLTLINGPIKQMLNTETRQNIKKQYTMILRNSDRLLGLINQILDLSKLESGEMKLKVSETNIVKYLQGLALSFASLAERKKITLKLDIKHKDLIGYVDRDKIEKIVTNLLSNAFKFTSEDGVIEVSINEVNSPLIKGGHMGVKISISNTGPGIPENQIDKIFDRFYQADDQIIKDGEGTGIGLALTKELVEICHGEISVESIPDKNTTFKITLPITKEYFKEDEIVKTTEVDSSYHGETPLEEKVFKEMTESAIESTEVGGREVKAISKKSAPLLLIVEDNPDVTSYISSFMENDYRIITAENGKIGLKKIFDKYPDLIISDVMMPEMDGFELCQKLKSDHRTSHIPVILLTARADLDSKLDGLDFGADDYINKPFEARELQARASNLIEQRQKLREKFSRLMEIKPGEITATSMDEQFLERLIAVSEKHLSESGYSTENLAREIGLSRSQLNRKLKALTDLSTHGFILNIRLKHAAQLLKKHAGTITEIAYTVGFNNPANFSKAFKSQYGQSPRDFVNNQK